MIDKASLTPTRRRILNLLIARPLVSVETLVSHLYDDDPDGGPDDPVSAVHAHVFYLRRYLMGHGVTIESRRSVGYRIPPEAKAAARQAAAYETDQQWRSPPLTITGAEEFAAA